MAGRKRTRSGQMMHQAIAQDIGTRILAGEFNPGTLLPKEAIWSRKYKMSRTAVREAIKMLAAKGLIISRTKVGSRVQPRDRWNLLDREILGWYSQSTDRRTFLNSIQQVRLVIEPEAAALAAANRTQQSMRLIDAAMAQMWQATSHEELVAADVNFHLSILRAAGNDLLVPLGFVIEAALTALFDYTVRPKYWKAAKPLHEAIAVAIRQRRPEAARRAVRKLLEDTDTIIERRLHASRGAKARRVARQSEQQASKPLHSFSLAK
jgi:DNA-binding FadR family transcriptional regulator